MPTRGHIRYREVRVFPFSCLFIEVSICIHDTGRPSSAGFAFLGVNVSLKLERHPLPGGCPLQFVQTLPPPAMSPGPRNTRMLPMHCLKHSCRRAYISPLTFHFKELKLVRSAQTLRSGGCREASSCLSEPQRALILASLSVAQAAILVSGVP